MKSRNRNKIIRCESVIIDRSGMRGYKSIPPIYLVESVFVVGTAQMSGPAAHEQLFVSWCISLLLGLVGVNTY